MIIKSTGMSQPATFNLTFGLRGHARAMGKANNFDLSHLELQDEVSGYLICSLSLLQFNILTNEPLHRLLKRLEFEPELLFRTPPINPPFRSWVRTSKRQCFTLPEYLLAMNAQRNGKLSSTYPQSSAKCSLAIERASSHSTPSGPSELKIYSAFPRTDGARAATCAFATSTT